MASEWEVVLADFLSSSKGWPLIEAALERPLVNGVCPVHFDGMTLVDACAPVLTALQKSPMDSFSRCHRVLHESIVKMQQGSPSSAVQEPKFRLRLSSLPPSREILRFTVPRADDAGHLLEFSGTVIKVTGPKVISASRPFVCSKCKEVVRVQADPESFSACPPPSKCPRCQDNRLNVAENSSTLVHEPIDYQEVKVQEKIGSLNVGRIPRSVWVTVQEDLVESTKPGDDVKVVGVVIRRWRPLGRGPEGRSEVELAIHANHIQVLNNEKMSHRLTEEQREEFDSFWQDHKFSELEGRNEILASFCPQVYGLYTIKLAVSIILCGGVERVDQSGTRVRGESHMLMVGDPGTGKSQVLKYAAKLIPRSILTSGIGSTNAGLTVSAVRDGGQWILEAGALVLADGGLCCIDEFSSIKETDRVAIHEAMEQQSISVAKAGIVTQLQTRCSILATANPKGKYDPEHPITVNIGVASPLLSRFDLVYVLLDTRNQAWDTIVSSFILQGKDPLLMKSEQKINNKWSFEKLQSFFSYCRQKDPSLSRQASQVLSRYYQKQRAVEDVNMARATVRLLQSAIRLAQGHARLMNHMEVSVCDAINAIILLETSFDFNASFLAGVNPLHTTFPDNPTEEYTIQAQVILQGLGLEKIWVAEKERLDKAEASRSGLMMMTALSMSKSKSAKPDIVLEQPAKKRKRTSSSSEQEEELNSSKRVVDRSNLSFDIDDASTSTQHLVDNHKSTKDKLKAFQAPPKPVNSQE